MEDSEIEFDSPMSNEQLDLVNNLTVKEIKAIDAALLNNSCQYFRKTARVIMAAMSDKPITASGIPDVYYGERIKSLVENGLLVSEGNLSAMRFSEVKLPGEEVAMC